MTDITTSALQAMAGGNVRAVPLAFLCGALASTGPCVTPRILAVSALTAGKVSLYASAVTAAFVAGLIAAYVALALSGAFLWRVFAFTGYAYALMAVVMFVSGGVVLVRGTACSNHKVNARAPHSLGATFLTGAFSALTVSPCCLPVVSTAAAYSASVGALFAAGVAAAFGLGHSVPLLTATCISRWISITRWQQIVGPAGIVCGTLMVAMAGLYGILA